MSNKKNIETVREALRRFNRFAGVLKSDPYGIGLSLSQASALVDTDRFGQLRPNDLARLLNLEKSSVSRLLDVLEERELIRTAEDPNDGRAKIIEITKAGKRSVDIINQVMDDTVATAFDSLSRRDQSDIVVALTKLAEAVTAKETV